MTDLNKLRAIKLPMIRRVVPNMIANMIANYFEGVQPMSGTSKVEFKTGTSKGSEIKHICDPDTLYNWCTPAWDWEEVFNTEKAEARRNIYETYCTDTFGPKSMHTWFCEAGTYYFAHEEHATMFALRWT